METIDGVRESTYRDIRLRRDIYSAYAKAKVCDELGEEYRETALLNWRSVVELSKKLAVPETDDTEIYREAQTALKMK